MGKLAGASVILKQTRRDHLLKNGSI